MRRPWPTTGCKAREKIKKKLSSVKTRGTCNYLQALNTHRLTSVIMEQSSKKRNIVLYYYHFAWNTSLLGSR
jgi:hypothetical protein